MKKELLCLTAVMALAACQPNNQAENTTAVDQAQDNTTVAISYPVTAKGDVTDSYFGQQISDPYRWLEDDRSAETAEWVASQNAVTFDYLDKIPYREKIGATLKNLINYERVTAPFTRGDYTYIYKNDGLQNQYVLYRKKGDGELEVFIDPNTFSEDGTTSMSNLTFTADGSILAYQLSEGGSDWRTIVIMDAESGEQLEPVIENVKFSGISWRGNEGFYYSSYDKPEGSELSAKTDQHKLYFHKLGTEQSEDIKVFGHDEAEKHRYISGYVSEDENYLFIRAANATSFNKLFVKDLRQADNKLTPIVSEEVADTYALTTQGDTLYLVTNLDAPNQRIVTVDAANPGVDNWQDFIPETDQVLSPSTAGGYIFARYMVDALSLVKQFSMTGEEIRTIELPDVGTASGFSARLEDKTAYFTFTNYRYPTTVFGLDVESGETSLFHQPQTDFDPQQYVSQQVFYTSKDGTKVPMLITHHKDLKRNGNTPTLLYGYGGFNISVLPRYSSTVAAWLELGGVYAVPNIRGGGEYGKEWHIAGTKQQKQNVFDDFIAAAEYLISENYTSSNYLALRGGSNGGLLVGAVMTQRPDLFKVALPAVGVLDMLRYHTFTAGAGWAYDYGTAEDSAEMFEYLKGYSPLHNVKAGTQYPATMITTADHDDRVVPAHSFKFAAELQSKQSGSNPTLIRIETNAGHGAGTPTSKVIEQFADIYGFTLYNMGIETL